MVNFRLALTTTKAVEWTSGNGWTGRLRVWKTGPCWAIYFNARWTTAVSAWTNALTAEQSAWIMAHVYPDTTDVIAAVASNSSTSLVLSVGVDASNPQAYLWDTAYSHAYWTESAGSSVMLSRTAI